jgi:hypothetical protein
MRVWDINPAFLCRQHLLGEHREIHAIYTILSEDRSGYRNHPEVVRWVGRLTALRERHNLVVREMENRGYNHMSDLPVILDDEHQDDFVNTIEEQIEILNNKDCECLI